MRIAEAVDRIVDRAHYVTNPGGPRDDVYISISKFALREALAEVFDGIEADAGDQGVLPIDDPEAPQGYCIPGPDCRHRHRS